MELKKIQSKLKIILHKYKYVALILIAGILLMMIPANKDPEILPEITEESVSQKSLDEDLASILCLIEGAGRVQVLLTVSAGEETLYQTDEDAVMDSDTSSIKSKTVIITNSDKAQFGLIKQINPPKYLGAVILCQGADSPAVRLAIIDAVGKITGLGADKISVLKMK